MQSKSIADMTDHPRRLWSMGATMARGAEAEPQARAARLGAKRDEVRSRSRRCAGCASLRLCQDITSALQRRGRSLIAPPLSTARCLLVLSPYQGHGSLRGRRVPPQHPVRSTVHNGLACNARGPRPSCAAGLHPRPGGQPSHPHGCPAARMDLDRLATQPATAPAPINETGRRPLDAVQDHRQLAGQRDTRFTQGLTASRSPMPGFSSLMPA